MSSVWDPPAPVTRFFIRFPSPWQRLPGFGFGLREAAIVGVVRGRLPDRFDPSAFDRLLEQLTREKLPEDIRGATDFAGLVARALFWSGAAQRLARVPVFGRASITPRPGGNESEERLLVAVPSYDIGPSTAALRWVEAALNGLIAKKRLFDGQPEQAKAQWEELSRALGGHKPGGTNTFKYLRDAHIRNIPVRQVLPTIYCYGTGTRSRWMQSSFTDRTSVLASQIAGNKARTAIVLRQAGLPAPTHARVKSPEEAVVIARKLGYPVVVKPADRQQGVGVAANLKDDAAVIAAYAEAVKSSNHILVEKHFDGIDYRMVVLDGRLLRVRGRLPGGVVGDGKNTIAQLVEIRKQAPDSIRRAHERGRQLLELDEEAMGLLAENGLSPNEIPAADKYVRLRRRGNVSAGGISRAIEWKDIHPDNIRMAIRAVAALRLDFGGLDAIFPDISKSWMETGALICEVNPQPQAASEILNELLEDDGRIPLIVVVGSPDCVDREQLRGQFSRHAGLGFASRDGVWLGEERIAPQQPDALAASRVLMDDTRTEAAVIVMSGGEISRFGLPTDLVNTLILDSPDHWSEEDRKSAENLLAIALPHAVTTLSVETAQPPAGWGHAERGQWQMRAEPVQRLCEEALGTILPAGTRAQPSSPGI
jgi:cyanophycin synthetase